VTMKRTLIAALLLSGSAFAQFPEATKEEVCSAWTDNAMYGATQRLRGSSSEIVWITKDIMLGLIEHGLGADRIYHLDHDDYTPEIREWIVSASTFGWTAMDAVETKRPGQIRSDTKWRKAFHSHCMTMETL
jgi:hypothetical protein